MKVRSSPIEFRLMVWNVKVGRTGRSVCLGVDKAMDGKAPHMVVLLEADGHLSELRKFFPHFRWTQERRWDEAGNIIVGVRKDVPVTRVTAVRMRTAWIGPKAGLRHAPRTYLIIDVGTPRTGPAWRFVPVHFPSGGPSGGTETNGRNAAAYAESVYWAEAVADKPGSNRRAFVLAGDFNATEEDRHRLSPAGLADAIGADVVSTNAKVDGALVRGCTGTSKRGGMHGSDHPVMYYTLTHDLARKAAA